MLDKFQSDFRRAMLADAPGIEGAFLPGRIPIEAGLRIYRNTIFAKLGDALSELYPVVKLLVGDGFFAYTAHEFVRAHPPRAPVMAEYGQAFPSFLANFSPAVDLPYLADVARLELTRHQALNAADRRPLGPDAFGEIPPLRLGDIVLSLHPSLKFLHSPYPVDAIWDAHRGERLPDREIALPERSAWLLIARTESAVSVLSVEPAAYEFVRALDFGLTLGEAYANTDAQWDPQPVLAELIAVGAFVEIFLPEGEIA